MLFLVHRENHTAHHLHMSALRKYRKRIAQTVVAVRIDLDTKGITYRKWGGLQRAKAGDWLVKNGPETYTVDSRVFAKTYRRLRPGIFFKKAPIWAKVATESGVVATKEGSSRYKRGDYLVFNEKGGRDGYCMSAARFKSLYQLAR